MSLFHRKAEPSSFAQFISTASSRDKKKVYNDVLKTASQSQKKVMTAASKPVISSKPTHSS